MTEPRVVVYREALFVASEPWLLDQASALRRYQPTLLGLRVRGAPPADAPPWVAVTGPPGLRRASRALTKLTGRGGVGRALARLQPDLVHAHFGRDAAQLVPAVRRSGVPLLVTFHGHDATRSDADLARGSQSDRLYLRRRSALIELTDLAIAVSDFIRDQLVAAGWPPGRVVTHHIGTDVAAVAAAVGVPPERVAGRVVTVGRLVESKGTDLAIEAVAALASAGRPVDLVVVGDGPQRAALEAQAARLGAPVRFRGVLARAEALREMAAASLVLCPARRSRSGAEEAFSIVALESQALGTPVVVTASGGLPECVPAEGGGVVVPPDDAGALGAAIEALLEDGPRWAELSERGPLRARSLDLSGQTALLERLYDRAIEAHDG